MNSISHFQFSLSKVTTSNPSNEILIFHFQPQKTFPTDCPLDMPILNQLVISPLTSTH